MRWLVRATSLILLLSLYGCATGGQSHSGNATGGEVHVDIDGNVCAGETANCPQPAAQSTQNNPTAPAPAESAAVQEAAAQ